MVGVAKCGLAHRVILAQFRSIQTHQFGAIGLFSAHCFTDLYHTLSIFYRNLIAASIYDKHSVGPAHLFDQFVPDDVLQ